MYRSGKCTNTSFPKHLQPHLRTRLLNSERLRCPVLYFILISYGIARNELSPRFVPINATHPTLVGAGSYKLQFKISRWEIYTSISSLRD